MMQRRTRNEITLAFTDTMQDKTPLVLIHGWGCDHRTLQHQQDFFSSTHRVVNVDLRGHGESDAPYEEYEISCFAQDIAWLCQQLTIKDVVLIGHSMGGAVAIETAYQFPAMVRAVAMIDTVFQPRPELQALLAPLMPGLQGEAYKETYREIMLALSQPTEKEPLTEVLRRLPRAPQHALLAALQQHMVSHNFARAAGSCTAPSAYIAASGHLADVEHLKGLIPHLFYGQTLGAGHFAPWLVADQVNAMLSRFLAEI